MLCLNLYDRSYSVGPKRVFSYNSDKYNMSRAKRIWYLSHMRAAKVQASLRIRAVSPEPPLLAHTSSESRGTFRQKARSLAPLNGWACAVKICHDGMLEDTNSLGAAHMIVSDINVNVVSSFDELSLIMQFCLWTPVRSTPFDHCYYTVMLK